MKTLALLLLIAAEPVMAKPGQVKIEVRYKNVDAKWFADAGCQPDKNGVVLLPSVRLKLGEKGTIEIIRERRVPRLPASGPVLPCGVTIEMTPVAEGDGFKVSGIGTLRRSISKKSTNESVACESQEVLIDMKLVTGQPKTIELSGGGQMEIVAKPVEKG